MRLPSPCCQTGMLLPQLVLTRAGPTAFHDRNRLNGWGVSFPFCFPNSDHHFGTALRVAKAYGVAEEELVAKRRVSLIASTPRIVRVGDDYFAGVTVTAGVALHVSPRAHMPVGPGALHCDLSCLMLHSVFVVPQILLMLMLVTSAGSRHWCWCSHPRGHRASASTAKPRPPFQIMQKKVK